MASDVLTYPIGDRLYVNLSDRCTLDCAFCPKNNGSLEVHDYDLHLSRRHEAEDVIESIGDPGRYRQIVFCGYGEPTLRLKPLKKIAHWVKQRGGRVRLNTDGLANRVYRRNVLPELSGCIDAISVSMNAQSEAAYRRHCRPKLPGAYQSMLSFLRLAPSYIEDVSTTAIEGLAGVDINACRHIAANCGVAFRRRALDVVG